MPTSLDFSNPMVALLAAVVAVMLLDLVLAGGGLSTSAACGMAAMMSSPAGWVGLVLVAALLLLGTRGLPGADGDVGGWALAGLLGLVLAIGIVAVGVWRRDAGRPASRPAAPEERLRERYAAGELTRDAYQEALVDVLKDRFARGELDVDAYEARLERLLAPLPRASGRDR